MCACVWPRRDPDRCLRATECGVRISCDPHLCSVMPVTTCLLVGMCVGGPHCPVGPEVTAAAAAAVPTGFRARLVPGSSCRIDEFGREGLHLFSPRPSLKKSAGLRCRSRDSFAFCRHSSRSDHGEPLLPWLGRARWEGALLACPRLPPLRACLAGAYPRPRPALAAKHLPSLRRRRSRLIH